MIRDSVAKSHLRIYSTIAATRKVESTAISSSIARKTLCCISSGEIKGAESPIRRPCKPERDEMFEVEASMAIFVLPSLLSALHT